MGDRPEKERQLVELVGDQSPSLEALLRSKRGESKGNVRRGATVRKVRKKGWLLRVIEGEEVRGDDPILSPHLGQKYLSSSRGLMAVEVPRMKKFMAVEKESVFLSVGEERIGGHKH